MLESEDDDTLLQALLLLFKLHNQGQLLVNAARSTYIVTDESTRRCMCRVYQMITFEDKNKIMWRLLQQSTDDYKDDIVSELESSAHSCMLAGNEAQPAEFMQNILFTSGMFIAISVDRYKSLHSINHTGYFSIVLEYVLKSCTSTDVSASTDEVLLAAVYLLTAVAQGNSQVLKIYRMTLLPTQLNHLLYYS